MINKLYRPDPIGLPPTTKNLDRGASAGGVRSVRRAVVDSSAINCYKGTFLLPILAQLSAIAYIWLQLTKHTKAMTKWMKILGVLMAMLSVARVQAQEWEWAKNAGSTIYWDGGLAIAIDASGNAYITGGFRG